MWQSAFLMTNAGVIVFDAPETFGKNIPSAIANVTDQPIKMLIYSHVHRDHIGGSAAFRRIRGLQIVALKGVSDFLKEQNDPNRPLPTEIFESQRTIKLGNETLSSLGTSTTQTKATFSSTYRGEIPDGHRRRDERLRPVSGF
jgi:glyoxylase-like metal-dependent hydrolase (beta-lactamase superfamily II)